MTGVQTCALPISPFTAAAGAGSMSNTNTTINVQVSAGVVADKAALPGIIVDALGTYVRQSGMCV